MKTILLLVAFTLTGTKIQAQSFRTATATATVYNGFVVAVTVTDGGEGYTSPPSVTFTGGGGAGGAAYSVISNGVVTQIIVTDAGSGYVSAPTVVISAPGNYSFRSGSAYVVVSNSPSLDSTTNQLTVECWFSRMTNPHDWNSLISRDTASFQSSDYELRFNGNEPYGTIHLNPPLPSSDFVVNADPGFPGWHHYAMQFDGTNLSIWLDGQLAFTTNSPGKVALSSNPLTIGCQGAGYLGGYRPFDGFIDEVRISRIARYSSAFTPEFIFTSDTNTVALYHFDEGTGAVVHDSSGNGNDGAIYGTPSWSTYVPTSFAVNVRKAVYVQFVDLAVGTNYQLQISTNVGNSWNNFGSPFTATNQNMTYPAYWNVDDWNELYFRLEQ